jgi:Glycosyltransferase sugar-binding region containing DXD motif
VTVPRRYLLVWMGPSFPYVGRLAVESIVQSDPDAEVEIHVHGELPLSSDLARLRGLDAVSLRHVDLDTVFAPFPRGAALRLLFDAVPANAHAARSNLLRYALLYESGGVYVDFDVLVRKPLADLGGGRAFVGAEQVWAHDQAREEGRWTASMVPATAGWALAWALRRGDCKLNGGRAQLARRLQVLNPLWSRLQPNNAVIGAPPESHFIMLLLDYALEVDPTVRYALGPALVSKVIADHPRSAVVLPQRVLYPVPPGESFRFFEDRTLTIAKETALIHYVASNHRELLAGIVEGDERFAGRSEVFWALGAEVERRRSTMRAMTAA